MRVFISGGCKNGKSTLAQDLTVAQHKDKRYYIATMAPVDEEDRLRIRRHQEERRDLDFETIECPRRIGEILTMCKSDGAFLLDSLTALLTNEMFSDVHVDQLAYQRILAELDGILQALDSIVIVSDFIYADGATYDPLTESYRFALAQLDKYCARMCDIVIECVSGNYIIHKGQEAYRQLYGKRD